MGKLCMFRIGRFQFIFFGFVFIEDGGRRIVREFVFFICFFVCLGGYREFGL